MSVPRWGLLFGILFTNVSDDSPVSSLSAGGSFCSSCSLWRSGSVDCVCLTIGCCSSNNTVILDCGAGNNRRYINISQLSEILEEMHTGLTEALLGYHAITGCDYVSCLFRKGKTTPFKRLIESTEHIQAMRTLTTNEVDVKGVTSFICSLYEHNTSHVNDARYNVSIRLTGGGIKAHTRKIKNINCASLPHVRNLWKSIYNALSMWLRSGKSVMHQIQQMDFNS